MENNFIFDFIVFSQIYMWLCLKMLSVSLSMSLKYMIEEIFGAVQAVISSKKKSYKYWFSLTVYDFEASFDKLELTQSNHWELEPK